MDVATNCRIGLVYYRGLVRVVIFWSVSLLSAGCVTTNFTQPVASFQQSVSSSSASLGTYFTELNSLERAIYFQELAADGTLRLAAIDANGQRTALVAEAFTADAIKARMNAINLLGVYAQRLSDLAGSDPGSTFEKNASALGTSLNSLDKTFSSLADPAKGTKDPKASQYVGPISSLIGTIGNMYLDGQRDKAIKDAVNEGSPKVNEILDLLEDDLQAVVVPLEQIDLKYSLAISVKDYNDRTAKLTTEQRAALLASIAVRSDAYSAAVQANPVALIQAIRTANAALVKYANASKTPQNFTQFLAALQTLSQSAQDVANDVSKIKVVH